jgi:hypothetical protein
LNLILGGRLDRINWHTRKNKDTDKIKRKNRSAGIIPILIGASILPQRAASLGSQAGAFSVRIFLAVACSICRARPSFTL